MVDVDGREIPFILIQNKKDLLKTDEDISKN